MQLTGLHILLTYQCTFECDHCFVWGSPRQSGTLTLAGLDRILSQAQAAGGIRSIYFEGGEPFLFYPVLLEGVRRARRLGFEVGVVTNSYWATSPEDAQAWLAPLVGLVSDLSISSDLYHWDEKNSRQVGSAQAAAQALGIPSGEICVAQPAAAGAAESSGQLAQGESAVMYRGRAAGALSPRAPHHPWEQFDACPHEDLRDPGRVHVDPFGNLHLCHGITLGNLFTGELAEICAAYRPEAHPISGPLLQGGPAELVRRYGVEHDAAYADACHLCDQARRRLRARFPVELGPDQMYGVSTS